MRPFQKRVYALLFSGVLCVSDRRQHGRGRVPTRSVLVANCAGCLCVVRRARGTICAGCMCVVCRGQYV